MSSLTKLGAFVAGLALVLAAAFGVGRAVGPIKDEPVVAAHHDKSETGSGAKESGHGGHGESKDSAAEKVNAAPGGLQVSESGYTLALDRPSLRPGSNELTFRILGPDGEPVTAYRREHDKDLHLIVVKRDLSSFQHVHPTRDSAGRWSVDVDLTPGTWRVFADFVPTKHGETLTLGTDLDVAGAYDPKPVPAQAPTATVGDYTVSLKGDLAPGKDTKLTLSVAKDGRPVADLQPYLGAYGHLVALRDGDLGYLHVHPDGEPDDGTTEPGPKVAFHATAPSAGTYRLYLDFKHGGVVRTAEFTVRTAGAVDSAARADGGHADDGHSH